LAQTIRHCAMNAPELDEKRFILVARSRAWLVRVSESSFSGSFSGRFKHFEFSVDLKIASK